MTAASSGPNTPGWAEHLRGNHVIWFKKHARRVETKDICLQKRHLEASCQGDTRHQRETNDLKPVFFLFWHSTVKRSGEIIQIAGENCNYYKSPQPTKATLSTLHDSL